jgi:ketosteroid isomerase-like protein
MKKFPLLAIIAFAACNNPSTQNSTSNSSAMKTMNLDSMKKEVMQADIDFSFMSASKGRNAAFLAFMDKNGVMLRTNSMPIKGRDTVAKIFASRPDTGFTLTWKPLYADVAASGELGYTYGTFLFRSKSDSGEGTYCTIWRKDSTGKWKYVMDTGNQGLKPAPKQK